MKYFHLFGPESNIDCFHSESSQFNIHSIHIPVRKSPERHFSFRMVEQLNINFKI